MAVPSLTELAGTQWTGTGEVWLDPEGNNVDHCECSLRIEDDALHYRWSFKSEAQEGSITFEEGGATWKDSWHQKTVAKCKDVPGAWGLFTIEHTYEIASTPA